MKKFKNVREKNVYMLDKLDYSLCVEDRKKLVNELLVDEGYCEYYTDLTDAYFSNPELKGDKRYKVIKSNIEFPLECLGSYLLKTTNSDVYLHRKFKDDQKRKDKDGNEYQRASIYVESELVLVSEDGDEYGLLEQLIDDKVQLDDTYTIYDDTYLSLIEDGDELLVAKLLSAGMSMAGIERKTGISVKKIKRLRNQVLNKILKWCEINEYANDYSRVHEMIDRKFKGFKFAV